MNEKQYHIPEPLICSPDETRQMPLNVLNVIEFRCERISHVNDDDLPVSFAFVEEGHDAEHLDLLDLADVADLLADLAHVERVVVTLGLSFGVRLLRVLPGLSDTLAGADTRRTCAGERAHDQNREGRGRSRAERKAAQIRDSAYSEHIAAGARTWGNAP